MDGRAAVALAKDGSAQVSLSDEAGERRLSITLTGDGIPSVMLGDGTRNRVAIGVSEKGLPTFNFRDAEGRTRTLFAILEDGQPVLQFKDAENNVLQQLPAPK